MGGITSSFDAWAKARNMALNNIRKDAAPMAWERRGGERKDAQDRKSKARKSANG